MTGFYDPHKTIGHLLCIYTVLTVSACLYDKTSNLPFLAVTISLAFFRGNPAHFGISPFANRGCSDEALD